MWSPYVYVSLLTSAGARTNVILTSLQCGHTFCQDCVQKWFKTINQPQRSLSRTIAVPQHLRELVRSDRIDRQQLKTLIKDLTNLVKVPRHPSYHCPYCRNPVSTSPVKIFAMKTLVQKLATVQGERIPEKDYFELERSPSEFGTPKSRPGPWEVFFPSA